jgi:hypothetical protein
VNLRNEGRIDIGDNASSILITTSISVTRSVFTGIVAVAGHGAFHGRGQLLHGHGFERRRASRGAGRRCGGLRRCALFGNAKQAKAYVTLKDRATLSVSPAIGNWMCLAPNADDAYGRFEATDDAVVTLGDASSVEMTMGGTSRAELVLSGNAQLLGGTGSMVRTRARWRQHSISLSSNALLSVRAVYGGSPADCAQKMTFAAGRRHARRLRHVKAACSVHGRLLWPRSAQTV